MTEPYPFPWKFEGYRYSDLYLMSQLTEAQVQKNILELMAAFDVDAVPIDAGGRRQRGRMMAAAKAADATASFKRLKLGAEIPPGFSDLEATLAPEGRSLYIEVKAPAWIDEKKKIIRRAGQPTLDQLQFLLSKHQRGALVLVAWSANDVENYLGPKLELNRRAAK